VSPVCLMLIPLGILDFPTGDVEALEFIDSATLGSTGSIDIQGIPADYTHLFVTGSLTGGTGNGTGRLQFNSDTGSNYYSDNARAGAASFDGQVFNSAVTFIDLELIFTTTTTYNFFFYVPNYQDAYNKFVIAQSGDASYVHSIAGWYASTSPITSIQMSAGNQLGADSTVSIWGIK